MAKEQKLKREEHQRDKTKISEELEKMEYEEMLPVEKKPCIMEHSDWNYSSRNTYMGKLYLFPT